MKKYIVALMFALATSVVFATPTPKQIENDLANKDYASAKSKVMEVLRDRPESARAHLLNAFLLIHVSKDRVAASEELKNAMNLDTKGDVKNSPLFGRVTTEIDMLPVAKIVSQPVKPIQRYVTPASESTTPTNESSNAWIYILLIMAGGAVVWYIYNKQTKRSVIAIPTTTQYPSSFCGGENIEHRDHRDSSSHNPYPSYASRRFEQPTYVPQQPVQQSQPMGMVGTAASVGAGVVAGNLITDLIRGNHHNSDSYSSSSRDSQRYENKIEESTPSPVSYEVERQSFSSGNDDSWSSRSEPTRESYSSGRDDSDSSSSYTSSDSSSSDTSSDW